MKILLVGAGYVGQELGGILASLGHETLGLRRSDRELSPGIRPVVADITVPRSLEALPDDIDQIVFGVAPAARTKEAYEAVYFRGVESVLLRFPKARFHLISSTAVYAESREIVDEKTTAFANTETAKFLLAGEALVLERPGSVVFRASGIYGPGRTRTIESLLASPPSGESRNEITNRIHRDDLARAIAFAVERALDGIFVATDSSPASLGEISDFLEKETLPTRLARLRETRGENVDPPRALRPGSSRSSKSLSNRRLLESGFSLEYPSFREGYRALFRAEITNENYSGHHLG